MQKKLSSHRELLRATFKTQVFTEKINNGIMPLCLSDKKDAKRCIVNTTPYHPGGKPMLDAYHFNGYYIEMWGGASRCIEKARFLLTF